MFEHVRMIIDEVNDARRVRKAREDYVREEGLEQGREEGLEQGREEGLEQGYNKAAAEYRGQLSAKDEQIRQLQEEVRRLDSGV
jgi:flagellar biosynthesis/type III secretory pathway protein FliH